MANPIQSEERRQQIVEKLSAFADEHEAIGVAVPVPVWIIDYIAIQEAKLDEAHKREVVLREALQEARDGVQDWASYAGEYFREKHGLSDEISAYDAVLAATSESATAWLKAHDREVLEKAANNLPGLLSIGGRYAEGYNRAVKECETAILGEEEP